MSQPQDVQDTLSDEEIDEGLTLEDVITIYLRWNPTPSDEQFHELATVLDIPYATLEEVAYRMFGELVGDAAAEELDEDESADGSDIQDVADDLVDDDDDLDSKDLFIITFFIYHPEPTEAQVHALAKHVGLTPEQFEERIFSLMSDALDDDSDD